jgi:hypothetical protein
MTDIMLKTPMVYSVVSGILVFISTILFCLEQWAVVQYEGADDIYWGLFLKSGMNPTTCDDETSSTACGYLKVSKTSGVIFVVLGTLCCLMYMPFVFPNVPMNSDRMKSAGICGTVQGIFGIICLVVFFYYKRARLTLSDANDVNVEFDSERYTSKFMFAYYFFMFLVIITCLFSGFTLQKEFMSNSISTRRQGRFDVSVTKAED